MGTTVYENEAEEQRDKERTGTTPRSGKNKKTNSTERQKKGRTIQENVV